MDNNVESVSSYDKESDSLYIFARRGVEEDIVELVPGVNIELDRKGEIIGIEILKASRFFERVIRSAGSPKRLSQIKEPSRSYSARKRPK